MTSPFFQAFFIAQWGRGPDWYSIYRVDLPDGRWFLITATRRESDGLSRIGQFAAQRMQSYSAHPNPLVVPIRDGDPIDTMMRHLCDSIETGRVVCLACESGDTHDTVFTYLNPSKEQAYRATETDQLVKMPMAQALDEVSATVVRVH